MRRQAWRRRLGRKLIRCLGAISVLAWAGQTFAECSPYEGFATINEVNKELASGSDNAQDFVEVKILDSAIAADTYSDWELEICENSTAGCQTFGLDQFNDSTLPWLVLKRSPANTLYDFSLGFNVILRDADGASIDYLDFDPAGGDSFEPLSDDQCEFSFDTKASQTSSGQAVKRIRRRPDGTGSWDSVNPQSIKDSEGGTNDDVSGNTPELTVSDASAVPGEDMVFTLSLSGTASTDLTVTVATRDGTALAGEDYSSASQTVVIPAGVQSVEVSVPTLTDSGGGEFYLRVSATGSDDPVIADQIGKGTIVVPQLAGFSINVGGSDASTCQPREIAFAALDASGQVLTGYDYTMTLSTSSGHGNWSTAADGVVSTDPAQGNLSAGGADSGLASYSFSTDDEGTVSLFLSNTHAETITISATDAQLGVTSTSSNLTFRDNAFVVTRTDSLGGDVIASRPHQFTVSLVRRDPDTGSCGPASRYNANAIKVWIDRADGDPGAAGPAMVTDTESVALPEAEPGSKNVTFPFVDGRAEFELETTDVGRYTLEFLDDSGDFSDTNLVGSSGVLVVRPLAFSLNVVDNPAASDAGGAVYRVAGDPFSVQVTAVGWSAQDDVDDDGVADGHDDTDPSNNADLSDNPVLTGFGQEVSAEGALLSARLVAPGGGADPGLADLDASADDGRILTGFSDGYSATSLVGYDEVGIIEVAAEVLDGDYLGAGASRTAKIVGLSGYVGRFRPAEFRLTNAEVTPFCEVGAGFSYMGQSFTVGYRLTPQNRSGDPTQNYAGDFVKLDARDLDGDGESDVLGQLAFGAVDDGSAALTDRLDVPPQYDSYVEASGFSWNGGVGDVDTALVFSRASSPDGPYQNLVLGVQAEDDDGVRITSHDLDTDLDGNLDHRTLASTDVRFGRLYFGSAFGPEVLELNVPLYTQFWDGSEFVRNVDDSCSRLLREAITYEPTGNLLNDANRTVPLDAGTTTGEYGNLDAVAVNFTTSEAGHYFTAPGAGNTGSFEVTIDLTYYPWLRFDWNQDGDHSNDIQMPPASIGFGSYRGHDRIIYWREVLE